MGRVFQSASVTRAAGALLLLAPVLLLGSMGYARRWVTEDAFIGLRVVQQILGGHGPVFNIGERVEAYTSPLWVAVLAIWGAFGGSLEGGAVTLGLVFAAAGVLLAQGAACRVASRVAADEARDGWNDERGVLLPFGAAIFAAVPVVWDFSTSGLESGLAIGWLGVVFWLLVRAARASRGSLLAAAFAIGCGPLVRPDFLLFTFGFGAALVAIGVWDDERRVAGREWVGLALAAAALPVGYQVFRMGYFGALVPNPALAKEATAAYWSQGWLYTLDFVDAYILWLPLLAVAAWVVGLLRTTCRSGDRVTTTLLLAPMLSGLLHWLYITRVGGDFMHGRLLLPSLFAFLLPVMSISVRLRGLRTPSWRMAAAVAVAGWVVLCAVWLRVPYAGPFSLGGWGITDERLYYVDVTLTQNPVYGSDYLRHPFLGSFVRDVSHFDRAVVVPGPDGTMLMASLVASVRPPVRSVLALANIGVLGYLVGPNVHVVDRMGLGDPIGARLDVSERGRPGHEKWLEDAWIVGRFGERSGAGSPLPTAARDAAEALACGGLQRLLQAVDEPLTVSRFVANIRDAWTLFRLRIPNDPATARERFCAKASV